MALTVFSLHAQESYIQKEEIKHQLSIGFFDIGESVLLYEDNTKTGDRGIQARAYSSGLLNFFYHFDFNYVSVLDKQTGLPLKLTKMLEEGKYRNSNTIKFDHFSRADSTIVYSDSVGVRVVQKNIFDILTGAYHLMNHQINPLLEIGDTVSTRCYFTDEVWDLRMVYIDDEIVETYRGDELCYKFMVLPQKGYFFKNDDDILFWFTKDSFSVPVKFRMNMVLSSIKGVLSEYTNTLRIKRPITP